MFYIVNWLLTMNAFHSQDSFVFVVKSFVKLMDINFFFHEMAIYYTIYHEKDPYNTKYLKANK